MKSNSSEFQKNNFKIVSKKLIVLVVLMVGTISFAQERMGKHQGREKTQFTPEQQSQLMLKKMTLELDLNESQQKEMSVVIMEKVTKMEAMKVEMKARKEKGVLPTNDERFAMKSKMLDEQIVTKKRLEKILNAKQFEKWSSLKEDRRDEQHGNPQERNRRQRRS